MAAFLPGFTPFPPSEAPPQTDEASFASCPPAYSAWSAATAGRQCLSAEAERLQLLQAGPGFLFLVARQSGRSLARALEEAPYVGGG